MNRKKISLSDITAFKTEHVPRPHVNALVRPHCDYSAAERRAAAELGGWNVFKFPSKMLLVDLLTDSGTMTLTHDQISEMMKGAGGGNYAISEGYELLKEQIERTFGFDPKESELYLFPQGRVAEHALCSCLKGEHMVVLANTFFDTTRANFEWQGIVAEDMTVLRGGKADARFLGNMNLEKLERCLTKYKGRVPIVYSTITNNTCAGQPVSMANFRATRDLCRAHGVSFFLDACRFPQNAYFVKTRERGYADRSIDDIVRETMSYADGITISFKKDVAPIGGALIVRKGAPLVTRQPGILRFLRSHQRIAASNETQGAMTEMDKMTIAEGLRIVTNEAYLRGRIGQVAEFGTYLANLGLPVVYPFGGHAVYLDTDKFFKGTDMRREDFGGIALTSLLLLKGVRLCELGSFAFGKYDAATGQETFPPDHFVCAAIPANRNELQDFMYVGDCLKKLHDRRDEIPCAVPVFGRDEPLRHFEARLKLV